MMAAGKRSLSSCASCSALPALGSSTAITRWTWSGRHSSAVVMLEAAPWGLNELTPRVGVLRDELSGFAHGAGRAASRAPEALQRDRDFEAWGRRFRRDPAGYIVSVVSTGRVGEPIP